MTKKIAIALFVFVLGASFAGAQSLAEASKKEKERRAALKGKQTVVTNADLAKTKKKAAMREAPPEKTAEEAEAGEEAAVTPEGEPSETPPAEGEQAPAEEQAQPAEGEAPPAEVQAQPVEQAPAAEPGTELTKEEFELRKSELEDAWNKAQELVELLTLKMNGLWQEFYSLDDMQARDRIQQQISETYEKLLRAQDDETKVRKELDDFIANTPREGVPKIWIR